MLTQTVTINQNSNPNIIIGRRSTYETQQVIFDVSWLVQTYGEGTAELLIKRPKDASAYPVVATLDGNTLTWTVSETDTQDKGHGECEIYWYVNGGLAKSCICGITILRDIGDTTETAPDPYETWVDELARLGAETLENAQSAEQSATSAAQSATEADNSAAAALESEENALDSENAAKASEQAAAASAQGAEQSAMAARQSATEAAQSASAAESSASDAQESADNSSASADRAEQAAASIEGDTERAEAAAREAQGAASYASVFADTASAKATEAAGSAATAEQAAATATQKAADASASATAAAGSASSASASATAAGNAQSAAETAQEAAETAAHSIEDSAAQIDTNTADILNLKSALNTKAGILRDTASGSVASFVPDATIDNLLGLSVALEPIQDLHGYDNPWPAGGGKNKLPSANSISPPSSLTVTNENGQYVLNGSVASGDSIYFRYGAITIENGFVFACGNSFVNAILYFLNGTTQVDYFTLSPVNRIINASQMSTLYGKPFSSIRIRFSEDQTFTNAIFSPMVVIDGADTTTFAPYENICPISGRDSVTVNANGTTHTIPLPETVYGGDVGVVSGDGESKMGMAVFDGTESWTYLADYHCVICGRNISDIESGVAVVDYQNNYGMKCRRPSVTSKQIQVGSSRAPIEVVASSADEWKALLQANPLQIVYRLAIPTPISTTPTEISTVEGENNVFSPDGDVTVEYAADLKTYIDNKIAAAVAALS